MSSAKDEVAGQYDEISTYYKCWFSRPWPEPVRRQGAALTAILTEKGVAPGARILDLTCGIGTQATGLALNGYRVTGMDISARQLEQAKMEAGTLGVEATWVRGDAARPWDAVQGPFDALISFGNSLPLIGDATAIETMLQGARKLLRPGGVFLASLRDHAKVRQERPYFMGDGPLDDGTRKGAWIETAEWLPDGQRYISHILFSFHAPERKVLHFPFPPLAALTQDEMLALLSEAGYQDVAALPAHPDIYSPMSFGVA